MTTLIERHRAQHFKAKAEAKMYNPDAHTPGMLAMGRRDVNEPPMQLPPHVYGTYICPACVKHEDDCWGKPCECVHCQPEQAAAQKLEQESLSGFAAQPDLGAETIALPENEQAFAQLQADAERKYAEDAALESLVESDRDWSANTR